MFAAVQEEEIDDVKVLPGQFIPIYRNPWRTFGLDKESSDVKTVRNSFRKSVLMFVPFFSGCGNSKMTLEQLLLAYHLIRGTVVGPAKRVKDAIENSCYFDFNATDILPLLRPIKGNFACDKSYRGFRMLNVVCSSCNTEFSYTTLFTTEFVFDVHYCMRRHTVKKIYDDIKGLHDPDLMQVIGLKSREAMGNSLAEYIMRIHIMLANKGKFSPRLFFFLGIDFEKVQSEEEGMIMSLLDTPTNPPKTMWHMLDEQWLARWRKFAMGRSPRRYMPPGPITNGKLAESLKNTTGRRDLVKGKDYRCVNYNVWRFCELVHGGGPVISRRDEDIYSLYGVSYLQAVIAIQTRMRIYLDTCKKLVLRMLMQSRCQVAKALIVEHCLDEVKLLAEEKIRCNQLLRTKDKLETAVKKTQNMWRKKKNSAPEENLQRIKSDQEVFSKSKGVALDEATGDESLVVRDVHPIIHIGCTSVYERSITESEGKIPFRLLRRPGTDEALIAESTNDQFIVNSRIVSVNSYPATSMTYDGLKKRLETAAWPLVLKLERPLLSTMRPTLDKIMSITDKSLQYNAFKILLHEGLDIVKHNSGNKKSHLSTIRLSDKELYYKSKPNPQKREDLLWNKLSLYSLKFILGPETVKKVKSHQSEEVLSRPVNPAHCFVIVTEDRELIFEFPRHGVLRGLQSTRKRQMQLAAQEALEKEKALSEEEVNRIMQDNAAEAAEEERLNDEESKNEETNMKQMGIVQSKEDYHIQKCLLLVNNMKALVMEVRGSQIYIDKDGLPIRRTVAKSSLRKLDR